MINILTKINGINNVIKNNSLLEIEFDKANISKIFSQLKDNLDLNFNQLLDLTAVDYPSREFRFDLIYKVLQRIKKLFLKLLLKKMKI